MFLKVNLTRQNINTADCGDAERCVLAQKANRLLLKRYYASVTNKLYVHDRETDKVVYEGHLSKRNNKIIELFDDGQLKPCQTLLNIPKKLLKPSVA